MEKQEIRNGKFPKTFIRWSLARWGVPQDLWTVDAIPATVQLNSTVTQECGV